MLTQDMVRIPVKEAHTLDHVVLLTNSLINDPYDCSPGLVNVLHIPPDSLEDFERRFFESMTRSTGLLSFSTTVSDPVVWSHYADSHRGIAFGFEVGDNDPPHGFFKVKYGRERRLFDFVSLQASIKADMNKALGEIIDAFTMKAESWSYEQEYRRFVILDACTPSGGHYFSSTLFEQLSRVVLGVRCSIHRSDVSRTLRAAGFPNTIQVIQATRHRGHYEVIVNPDHSS